jgi:predicted nucleic acid-binding protein
MSVKSFVDTNVLIYAHDVDAGEKHDLARSIVRELWETQSGIISTQVLQEFYVNVTRKIPKPLRLATTRGIVNTYRVWQVETITPDTIVTASEVQERHQISFWDAMIVAAACQAGADRVLTEDLNSGQIIEGVEVENPFA